VDVLVEHLDQRLRQWRPEIVETVRRRIAEIIELADHDALDLTHSRTVE
jgi:hypothetical protein